MRRLLYATLTLLCFLSCTIAYTQPHIEKSEAFDEPDDGYNKILQMKNGNTFFFHFARKEGIEINIYDKSRKLTATKDISSDLWDTRKMRRITVAGLYEINNEAVLFIVETESKKPTLYRMRINGTTGDMVKEDEVGSNAKGRSLAFATSYSTIYVEKDPRSDCYAVIFFNGYSKDPDDKIKVMHFDGSHAQLSAASYDSPDDNFKYLVHIGAVVDGNKRVFIACYGTRKLNGDDSKVFVSQLKAGEKTFVNKALSFTEDFRNTQSVMAYNPGTNSLQLLTLSFVRGAVGFFGGAKTKYLSFMSYIDPETLDLKSVKPLAGAKINEYAHTALNTDVDYKGVPQNMIINKDNSTTILSEELTQVTKVYRVGNSTQVVQYTLMGGIGVNELTADGNEKSGYWVRKMQRAGGLYFPLYISSRIKGRWTYMQGSNDYNSYMSYDYVSTDKNRYILFNDNDKNFDQDEEDEKRKVVVRVNKLNTICYSLNGNTVNKSFLFGEPGEKGKSNSLHLDASDYDQASGSYATIMVERDGRDRSAKVVWIKFD